MLEDRGVHPDVLRFCKPELVDGNYFHAVLETTKSVAQKIRDRTGLLIDGVQLVNEAFTFNGVVPYLALSSLSTPTEQGEQRGFMTLLSGVFGTFRNPVAHAPRVSWQVSEQDALDLLTFASYLHRRLDKATRTPRQIPP
ncbi:TIGR02391 family protein [Melittangium boletus]|uniref:TIGR02391 family protein n=1 Tax=Melittangium boletus TaxID=83453 RepID=UPI003DA29E92